MTNGVTVHILLYDVLSNNFQIPNFSVVILTSLNEFFTFLLSFQYNWSNQNDQYFLFSNELE
jgi:hypothetical protein